jgi:hypothetical protein
MFSASSMRRNARWLLRPTGLDEHDNTIIFARIGTHADLF